MALYFAPLAQMDDEHLVASVRASMNALTTTPIEVELLRRFEAMLDQAHDIDAIVSTLFQFDYTTREGAELLRVCGEESIADADQLRERFARFGKTTRKPKEKK